MAKRLEAPGRQRIPGKPNNLHHDFIPPVVPPELPAELLTTATDSFQEGDLMGAISSAFGAVDVVTTRIYREKDLGDPHQAGFEEKVSRCLDVTGVLEKTGLELIDIGWEMEEADLLTENLRAVLDQGVTLMQRLRKRMGDSPELNTYRQAQVLNALKRAAFLVSLFSEA